MAKPLWTSHPWDRLEKSLVIEGPDGLVLKLDNDDTPHHVTQTCLPWIIEILNRHWNDLGRPEIQCPSVEE